MAQNQNPISEDTARHLLDALQRVLDVLPSAESEPRIPASPAARAASAPPGVRRTAAPAPTAPTTASNRLGSTSSNLPTRTSSVVPGARRAHSTQRQPIVQEHARLFGYSPSAQPPKKKKCKSLSRIVLCLAGCDCEVVPSREEKAILKANGLGEKTIEFKMDGTAEHVQEKILSAFNKKELTYGFEFLVTRSKSRSVLELVHTGPCSTKELKLMSTQRVYIRPIQQDIELTETSPPTSSATLACFVCGGEFPTSDIRAHVEHCKLSEDPSRAEEPIQTGQISPTREQTQEPVREQRPHNGPQETSPTQEPPPTNTPTQANETMSSLARAPGSEGNEDQEEINTILQFLQDGFDSDSDVANIVTAFREVLLDGRSLNLPDGIADSFREGETYEIVVSRLDIFGSMLDELSVPTLNPRLPLKVTFMGEMGQDLGGPRREFMRLCLEEIFNRVTTGSKMSRDLERSQANSYLDKKVYYVAGIVIGLCIIQDGPVPHFLSSDLVDRLVEGSTRDACEKQLSRGLQKTGVLSLVRAFPQCRRLLHSSTPPPALTSTTVISSFKPIFSESGTGIRAKEKTMMGHFVRYVREVEAGQRRKDGDPDGEVIQLHHIFQFVTGLKDKPVCGWMPSLKVSFTKQDVGTMGIGACTCSHQLQLPVPLHLQDAMPPRSVFFDLFDKSFPDKFFGKA